MDADKNQNQEAHSNEIKEQTTQEEPLQSSPTSVLDPRTPPGAHAEPRDTSVIKPIVVVKPKDKKRSSTTKRKLSTTSNTPAAAAMKTTQESTTKKAKVKVQPTKLAQKTGALVAYDDSESEAENEANLEVEGNDKPKTDAKAEMPTTHSNSKPKPQHISKKPKK